jgi:hypothetical protein
VRALSATLSGLCGLVSAACNPPASDVPIEAAASELFGVEVRAVESSEGHARPIEDCAWERGVLVPPEGRVRIPLRRGAHTLTGMAAICDGRPPGSFAVRVVEPDRTSNVLALDIDADSLRRRPAEPFVVTFWAEQDGEVQLLTTRGPFDAHLAWLGVRLTSTLAPPTGLPARLEAAARFADTSPGRRTRKDPLIANERGRYWLTDFGWEASSSSWGPIEIDRSNGSESAGDGAPLSVGGRGFERGIGLHAPSLIFVRLGGTCQRFTAGVGVDDGGGSRGSAQFRVVADDEQLWESPIMLATSLPARVEVGLEGKRWMRLEVTTGDDGPEGDWADWLEPELSCDGG